MARIGATVKSAKQRGLIPSRQLGTRNRPHVACATHHSVNRMTGFGEIGGVLFMGRGAIMVTWDPCCAMLLEDDTTRRGD